MDGSIKIAQLQLEKNKFISTQSLKKYLWREGNWNIFQGFQTKSVSPNRLKNVALFCGQQPRLSTRRKASSLKRKEWLGSIFATYIISRKMRSNFCNFPNFCHFLLCYYFLVARSPRPRLYFVFFFRHFSNGQSSVVKWQ